MNEQQPADQVTPNQQPENTVFNTQGTSYQPVAAQPSKKRSLKWLWITLAVLGAVLLVGGSIAYGFYLSFMANLKATSYMQALKDSNDSLIVELSGADPSDPFIVNVKNGLKDSTFTRVNSSTKNSAFIIEFDVENSSTVKDTLIKVEKGKITSLLLNVRNKVSYDASAGAQSKTTPKTTSSGLACLTQDDYKWMNYNKEPSTVTFDTFYDPSKYSSNKTAMMFFEADSIEEDSLLSIYDDWADFAKHNTDKSWKFRLEGSINDTQADTTNLANQRSERVKQQLIDRGVPADRIVIDAPVVQNDSQYDDIFRRVQVTVDPTCTEATGR